MTFPNEVIEQVAQEREDTHADHASSRPLSPEYEVVGLHGEWAFGRACGIMPDLARRPGGDNGADFHIPLMFSVDVKTARKANNLIHEVGKPFADIYVLAKYDDDSRSATLVGWAWGHILAKAPSRDFGYGIENHYIPRARLRPMSELWERLATIQRVDR